MPDTATPNEMPIESRDEAKLPEWLVTEAPFEIPEETRRRPYLGIGGAFVISILLWTVIIGTLVWLF